MIINAKIARLEMDAELAWHDGNETEGRRLYSEIAELENENETRMAIAKSKFATFPQSIQDEAELNASQTAINASQTKTFFQVGSKALQMCEFWESAADSAQFLADCN